nr:hypothetical protein [Tanacetum cinerariifolium]
AANLSTHTPEPSRRFNYICYDDDDYDYKERNEELNTIPEKESDEFIKSSVEDLVPIPSESEDTFRSDSDVDKINDFKDGYYDLEGDILYFESMLNDDLVHHDPSIHAMSVASILKGFTNEPPFKENYDLFDLDSKNDDWKKILYDAPIDDLMSEDKIFEPGICVKFFSPTYVSLPFEDPQILFFTYVVRNLLLYFPYPVVSHFLISSGSEDTIFDPGIFAFHFSHQCGTFISFNVYPNILNERPMKIFSSTRFTPNITMI